MSITRARWLVYAALLGLLAGCRAADEKTPVNVVLISIDSLRADHVHAYGYRRRTTPALDRLARQGALFENVIAESSWTLPTHVTMLTGLPAVVHGVEQFSGSRYQAPAATLAEILGEEGYQTYGVFSGPYLHPAFGLHRGFDLYESATGDVVCVAGECNTEPGSLETDDDVRAARLAAHESVTSPLVTQRAVEFLRRVDREPFFMFLHYFDVHFDYAPPGEYATRFDPDYQGPISGRNFETNRAVHPFMPRRDLDHVIALYDGEILYVDTFIGRFVQTLKSFGFDDDTLVVVTSDHGDEFFEHEGKGHGHTLYDEVLKVPLILRLPNEIPAGLRVETQVRHLDILPTILGFVGQAERARELAGTNLAPWIAEGTEPPARAAISRLRGNDVWISFRTHDKKLLVRREEDTQRATLYDLRRDPEEKAPLVRRAVPAGGFDADEALADIWDAFETAESALTSGGADVDGSTGDPAELPDDVREQLRSLGYIP